MHDAKIRLINGPYDGLIVEGDPKSEILWVYKNMYGALRAVKAGGLPRTPTMAAYVVLPGRLEALPGAKQPARPRLQSPVPAPDLTHTDRPR